MMKSWEYMAVKLYEFGSDQAELKRPGEFWVSDYGMLPLLQKLGQEGWEAVCQVGRDVILKRPVDAQSKDHAVVGMEAHVPAASK